MKTCGQINLGGTGEMHLCKNELGEELLFKPAVKRGTKIVERFRADIQVAASKLQQIISPDTAVRCELANIDGREGTIQPKIKVDTEKTDTMISYYYGEGILEETIARQFMREYVLDYCLFNYDSHCRNFIIDENGNLRGVDKEQSFRYMKDPEAANDFKFDRYHPNRRYGEEPPIYGKIFADIEAGILPASILEEVTQTIQRVRAIPKNEYLDIFTPYAESLGYQGAQLGEFYSQILDRVDSLVYIEKMIQEMTPQKHSLTDLSQTLKFLKTKLQEKMMSRSKKKEKDTDIMQ